MSSEDASKPVEYNILLLGETGVGKSTFVNAFANYLSFETLDDAMEAPEIISLIPSTFTIMEDNFELKEIVSGVDENETLTVGSSATLFPRIYKFPIGDVFVNLIDTPGIGDTRGVQKDDQNFDNVLTTIGQIKYLHMICILLKPNHSRITVYFDYCIRQCLTYLERSAVEKIVFVFTNSRSTFYRPGDTMPALLGTFKNMQSRRSSIKIPLTKENVFCLDNEAFRFLLAKKQGVQFSERDKECFDVSWRKSVDACLSLLVHMTTTKPHKTQNTISVNEARRLIFTLSEPLAIVAKNITDNVQSVNKREEELLDESKSLDELQSKLYVPVIKIRSCPLSCPRTVCADSNCTEITEVENVKRYHFRKACHEPCGLKNIIKEVKGMPNIRECDAFQGQNNCIKCGHTYRLHMHIYYITEIYSDRVRDTSIEENIRSKKELMVKISEKIEELKERRMRLIDEKEIIESSVAQFAHFLKNNALSIYNDKYQEYIQMLIYNEKSKNQYADLILISNYEQLMTTYEEKKRVLDISLAEAKRNDSSVSSIITAEQIVKAVEDLNNLPINGPDIKSLYRTVYNVCNEEILRKAEKMCRFNVLKKYISILDGSIKSSSDTTVKQFWEKIARTKLVSKTQKV